ncbi:MAG: RnfABCDGE type electron transport complex subunit D [Candidatus Omnitrophota bacterium]
MSNNIPLTVALSPHTYSKESIETLMYGVIIALIPAGLMGIYVFGFNALVITLTAVFSCVALEFLVQKYVLKVPVRAFDGSAIITGTLLAFNLPSNLPLWMVVIGSAAAILIAKMTFGGLGNNPFNPALIGRVFLLFSFPVHMTTWPKPFDAVTAATPLGILKEGVKEGKNVSELMQQMPGYFDLFLGRMGGCIGEISALALLIGFVYLLWKKIITWHIPVSMVGTIFVFTGLLWLSNPERYADPLFQILTGGVMLGAIFMATDYVTSPMTKKGMLIFGALIGVLTVLIRIFGSYPEGVSFAILISNAFVPLINRYCKPRRFGEKQ